MCVVAEGVEKDAQLAFLRERGCDRVQGYYFSPPLPGEEMLTYLLEAPKLRAVADSS
jgi:EAL domain-containing protein (putative c-di-GMP-specific phosphodiesterase class I)